MSPVQPQSPFQNPYMGKLPKKISLFYLKTIPTIKDNYQFRL